MQSARDQGPEDSTAVLPDVPRADPHAAAGAGAGQRHARVHAAGVCLSSLSPHCLTIITEAYGPSASPCSSSVSRRASPHFFKWTPAFVASRECVVFSDCQTQYTGVLLCVESRQHRQEYDQRQDVPREAVCRRYVCLGALMLRGCRYSAELELEDAIHTAILTLKACTIRFGDTMSDVRCRKDSRGR